MNENENILEDNHPIFAACEVGDLELAKRYFQEGVSVHSQSYHNPSLIGIAAFRNHKELIDLMIQYGLDITRPHNRYGSSVAEFAIKRDSLEWLEYFVNLGVPVDAADKYETTLLSKAAAGGKMESLRFLLDKGASINKPSYHTGHTPFRNASNNNQIEAMEKLWELGSDIEIRDSTKATPLISCAKGGKLEAIEWLLDHGADILAEDERSKTAEDWARENGHTKIVELLKSRIDI
jgi:ankyrin repeat protein